jgi:phosphate transport system substrate-binding protein
VVLPKLIAAKADALVFIALRCGKYFDYPGARSSRLPSSRGAGLTLTRADLANHYAGLIVLQASRLLKWGRCALTAWLLVAMSLTPLSAATLTIAGSTTFNTAVMVPYQKAIESATGHTLVIVPNRTELGIKLLLEHSADLAMISTKLESVSRNLRSSDLALPVDRLVSFDVYRARIVFTIHPTNSVRSINTQQLKAVLVGEITNWRELGGPDLPIRLVMVDAGAGIPLTISSQLLEGKQVTTNDAIRVRISSQVAKVVEQEPGALGLTQERNVTSHKIEIMATEQTIEQELSYVTLDQPSPAVKSVIDATRAILSAEQ